MRLRIPAALTCTAGLVVSALAVGLAGPASADPADTHHVTFGGTGITTWPAYDVDIDRFALATTGASTGAVTVTPESAPGGTITVNGVPTASGATRELTGLEMGDEVNVQISDSEGTTNQSWIYVPPAFPHATTETHGAGPDDGYVFLTLTGWAWVGDKVATAVDRNGVPIFLTGSINPMDFKPQPAGGFTIAQGHDATLSSTFDIVHLDSSFNEVASYNTVELENTEFHDSILEPDGSRLLMAYEPAAGGKLDSIVQDIAPDGTVRMEWNSADYLDGTTFHPTTNPDGEGLTNLGDYAHLNSIDVTSDNNLLLSFRHTSSVLKVNRETGAVMWRLGGTQSDFDFVGDPYGGPCAQHTARELANGDIQIWDNGSKVGGFTPQPMCPNPAEPDGARIERAVSRMVTYHLDDATDEATMVKQSIFGGSTPEFSEFAGSAQRLDDEAAGGHTLVGTADGYLYDSVGGAQLGQAPDAVEYDASGDVVWSLTLPDAFSYRALKGDAPDEIEPTITTSGIVDGVEFTQGDGVTLSFSCTDAGGSNLDECSSSVPNGGTLPDSVGAHTVTVDATDGAGNSATTALHYTVKAKPSWRPDGQVRRPGNAWRGAGYVGAVSKQTVTVSLNRRSTGRRQLVDVWVRNAGNQTDRFTLTGTAGNRVFAVDYRANGGGVTRAITRGTLRTPQLAPGQTYRVQVLVTRTKRARTGQQHRVTVRAVSLGRSTSRDAVAVLLRGTR